MQPVKLCMPCGQIMLAIPPGASHAQVRVAINKLCNRCKSTTLLTYKAARVPDFETLREDREEGFANVKQKR